MDDRGDDSIMNTELYHWKYVKREKKNGKWVYTYDIPTTKTAKKNYEQAQKNYIDATNRLNGPLMSSVAYRDAANEIEKANIRGQKAIPTTEAGRQYIANRVRHEHAKIELNKAEKAYNKSLVSLSDRARSAVKGVGESVKQKTKDILGYDERAYKDYASDMHDKAGQAYRKEKRDYSRSDMPPINTEEGLQARLDRNARLDELRKTYFDWGDEYAKANEKFMKTPLGIYTKAAEAIEMAAYDVGIAAEKVTNKAKDIAEDAVFEVEYAAEGALGLRKKRDYEWSKDVMDEYETELKRAERDYKKDKSDEFFKWRYQQALQNYKESQQKYERKRRAYAKSPVGMVDIGHEYVEEWFSDRKKKKK